MLAAPCLIAIAAAGAVLRMTARGLERRREELVLARRVAYLCIERRRRIAAMHAPRIAPVSNDHGVAAATMSPGPLNATGARIAASAEADPPDDAAETLPLAA